MIARLALILVLCATATSLMAQVDSSRTFAPVQDTSTVHETTDTTTQADTLTAIQRAAQAEKERLERQRLAQAKAVAKPRFSALDTLITYFAPSRLNQREWLAKSFAMDAADYFKTDPGYFVLKPLLVPMRNTVQPYGLTGDRMNIVSNGLAIRSFDMVPEPDGMMDLSDVPTALDDSVYVLPGALGMIFGGDNAIATLLTRTAMPADKRLRSALILDKGQGGYSHARGRYSNHLKNGRVFDFGLGYRVANDEIGFSGLQLENTYQYTGDVYWPVGGTRGIRLTGYVNDRQGRFYLSPESTFWGMARARFDRNFRASFVSSNDSGTVRTEYGYEHIRQSSDLTGTVNASLNEISYKTRLDNTGHSLFGHREWLSSGHVVQADVVADWREYANGYENIHRTSGGLHITYARPYQTWRLAGTVGGRYVEAVRFLPEASLTMLRESERFLLLTSLGYAEREPSLNDWYLPFTRSIITYSDSIYLADRGNPKLSPERQITGTVRAEWGPGESVLRGEVTAGKIFSGIEWQRSLTALRDIPYWQYRPINTGETFFNATLSKRVPMGEWFSFLGGASYHKVAYDSFDVRPYQPKYQAFGGLELHYYWRPKLIHLWAYGEVTYVGPYEGYLRKNLGENALFNGKLSFSMSNFRFRLVYQDLLNQVITYREGFEIPAWLITWGFTWNFFD